MKTKEIIVCIIVLGLLMITMSNVFATGEIDFNSLENNTSNTTNTNTDDDFENIPVANTNTETNTNVASNVNTNIDKDGNPVNNAAGDLPKTGIDNSILIIVAICGISAIYAHKKIKDYNIK